MNPHDIRLVIIHPPTQALSSRKTRRYTQLLEPFLTNAGTTGSDAAATERADPARSDRVLAGRRWMPYTCPIPLPYGLHPWPIPSWPLCRDPAMTRSPRWLPWEPVRPAPPPWTAASREGPPRTVTARTERSVRVDRICTRSGKDAETLEREREMPSLEEEPRRLRDDHQRP